MREFSFGQYYPQDSVIHKLDPRFKLVMTICYIVAIFLVKEFAVFVLPVAYLVVAFVLSKVSVKAIFKTLKPILVLVIITAILNLFFYQTGEIIFEWWIIKIRDEGVMFCLFMAVRLILLVMGSSILTLTTQPVELTDALESLLTPLKWIKFPVHELALIMSIALRFIPTLIDEADRIIRAQKARGADFDSGNIFKRAKALVPILIPLLVSSFRRADELADAMDARCYSGGKNRTKYKKFFVSVNDFTSLIFTASLILLIIVANGVLA